ncbi:MAG TPA: hypothetical protein VJX67_11975, partial [Blastocatellia bacterium]|nr:hypothetical protein [Blastocatellia bacterium]
SRPDVVGSYSKFNPRNDRTFVVAGTPESGNFLFDPTAFRNAGANQVGTLGRNVLDGPGLNLWSASIGKRFAITESQQILLRADIRNLFNHANFEAPATSVDSISFGQVTSAAPGRTVQLSLRYSF